MPSPMASPCDKGELYLILGINREASADAIKRAYYKLALQVHPDRCGTDSDTTAEFQRIGRAYEVLSDSTRRKLYDETGIIDGDAHSGSSDWAAYFRELFTRVTFADLDEFKATYTGSVEEHEDVLAAYVKHRGDIVKVAESIFFGNVESESRYLAMIRSAINKGIVPAFASVTQIISDEAALRMQQRKRRKRAEGEAEEAAQLAKDLGINFEVGKGKDLAATIQARQKGRFDTLIANLEAKYSTSPKDSALKKPKKTKK